MALLSFFLFPFPSLEVTVTKHSCVVVDSFVLFLAVLFLASCVDAWLLLPVADASASLGRRLRGTGRGAERGGDGASARSSYGRLGARGEEEKRGKRRRKTEENRRRRDERNRGEEEKREDGR